MGKYNGTDILAKFTILNGRKLKLTRELHMDLVKLGDYSISVLDDLNSDINNFDKYDDIDIEYSSRDNLKYFPSYLSISQGQFYREGIFYIDFATFSLGCFVDCLNINPANNYISVLFIVHY